MNASQEYALMAVFAALIFVADVVTETYAFLVFPIVIPMFVLAVIAAIITRDENDPSDWEDSQ